MQEQYYGYQTLKNKMQPLYQFRWGKGPWFETGYVVHYSPPETLSFVNVKQLIVQGRKEY
jgi:hypothetical protein